MTQPIDFDADKNYLKKLFCCIKEMESKAAKRLCDNGFRPEDAIEIINFPSVLADDFLELFGRLFDRIEALELQLGIKEE